jgi:hypothetical protein
MGFFDSEIVQQEAKQLFEDYQALIKLGSNYGKFDREGKKAVHRADGSHDGALSDFYEAL